jgi:brefeldin A-inhibited guanine nucleotide-exchange protein
MWNLVRDHFSEVGTRANNKIAIFAVEQLKQLSVKFLQKEELSSFSFQREFLKPFETIFLNVESEEIKEYILSCMHSIVLNYKSNIKSGWRVIFDLINFGLQEESDKISRTAF